jgi:hypothetical protein
VDNPLLPCPFCGAPAKLGHTPFAGESEARPLVQCTGEGCWATIEGFIGEGRPVEAVVAAWNRRVGQAGGS